MRKAWLNCLTDTPLIPGIRIHFARPSHAFPWHTPGRASLTCSPAFIKLCNLQHVKSDGSAEEAWWPECIWCKPAYQQRTSALLRACCQSEAQAASPSLQRSPKIVSRCENPPSELDPMNNYCYKYEAS